MGRNTVDKYMEEKQRFIQLRGKGLSFDRIAEELSISKPTLIKWSGEFMAEVKEAQFYEFESLVEKYGLMRKSRFEVYCRALNSALHEFQERAEQGELKKVSTEKLFNLVEQLEERLERDTQKELVSVDYRDDFKINEQFLEVGG